MKGPRLKNFLLLSIFIHLGILVFIAYHMEPTGEGGQKTGVVSVGLISVKSSPGNRSHNNTPENHKDNHNKIADNARVKHKRSHAEPGNNKKSEKEMTTSHRNTDQNSSKNDLSQEKKNLKRTEVSSETGETERNENDTGLTNDEFTEMPSSEEISNPGNGHASDIASVTEGQSQAHPDYSMNPKPLYPLSARRRGYEGTVKLRVQVLKSGKVGNLEIEKPSGYGILDKAAVEAVEKWIFIPGKKNGIPVTSWVTVPVKFRLTSG